MRVLVLMSTYNGERFLKEQIDSILSQEGIDVRLLIRDDGSKDGSCGILDEYCVYKNVDVVKGENLGFVKSFSKLVEMAVGYEDEIDYYAFADQDDVWFSNKLMTGADALSAMNQNLPLLFSSNSTYIDAKGNVMGFFHEKMPYRTRENVMIYPTEQGCSMMFNIKAAELYNMHPPVNAWHDRWMCLICNFMGETVYCHEPLLGYRVHGGNALGSKVTFVEHIKLLLRIILRKENPNYLMVVEFTDMFSEELTEENKALISIYTGYKTSFSKKIKLLQSEYQLNLGWWNRVRKAVLLSRRGL